MGQVCRETFGAVECCSRRDRSCSVLVLVIESKGKRIPFGPLVDFMPRKKIEETHLGKFEQRVRPGIFLGHVLQPGGRWEGAYEVAPLSTFQGRWPR